MNICVVGAGAIGGWVAAKLALAGNEVMALTSRGAARPRSKLAKAATDAGRLQLSRFDGPAGSPRSSRSRRPRSAAAAAIGDAAGRPPDASSCRCSTACPGGSSMGCSFGRSIPTDSIADGAPVRADHRLRRPRLAAAGRVAARVIVKHADKLIIGEPGGGDSERLARLVRAVRRRRTSAATSPAMSAAPIWYKLWGNATINPLSALTRATADRLLADPRMPRLDARRHGRACAIGAAIGCPISESGEDRMAVTARLGAFKTSMLQDVEAGRPIELEALLGAPREIARAHRDRNAGARPALRRHQADGARVSGLA